MAESENPQRSEAKLEEESDDNQAIENSVAATEADTSVPEDNIEAQTSAEVPGKMQNRETVDKSVAEREEAYDKLSVVLPAYNEAETITESVKEVVQFVGESFVHFEIVVVNDGSDDETGKRINDLEAMYPDVQAVSYEENRGKGHALKRGSEQAEGDYVLFLDADFELDPELLKQFEEAMEEEDADIVVGSKRHPESDVDYPWNRRFLSRAFSLFIGFLFSINVSDTQVGMKLFRAEVIEEVMPLVLVKEYAFDVELLALGQKKGYEVTEAPVSLNFNGDSNVNWRAILRIAVDTAAIFYRLRIRRYYDNIEER